ncbi:MAG TPA: hypothetical protein VND64_20770 [Pirellulales bacterium]|nr:hypothetical protein [Pirellulales bacterium]
MAEATGVFQEFVEKHHVQVHFDRISRGNGSGCRRRQRDGAGAALSPLLLLPSGTRGDDRDNAGCRVGDTDAGQSAIDAALFVRTQRQLVPLDSELWL